MRRDAIEKVGRLDEIHFPHWGSTSDWQCRAARKGFRIKILVEIPGFTHLKEAGPFGASTLEYLRKHRNKIHQLLYSLEQIQLLF